MKKLRQVHRDLYRYSLFLAKALRNPSIAYLAIIGNLILFLCAIFFFIVEEQLNPHVNSFGDAIWWAFTTVTTVGYGDVVAATGMGRVISVFLMISGAILFLDSQLF